MPVKLSKKILKEFIRCDGCGICIGPKYATRKYIYVGSFMVCPFCYGTLERQGFIYTEYTKNMHTVIYLDGSKEKLTAAKLEKLRKHSESLKLGRRP